MRPRRTVLQSGHAFKAESLAPFAHGLAVDTRADATAETVQPLAMRSIIGIRLCGVVLTFLMKAHPRLLETEVSCRNNNLPSKPRTNNLHSNGI